MDNKYFYCYSKRLMYFLKAMKFDYIHNKINKNTNVRYWTFEKSIKLDEALSMWNKIKNSF